MLSNPSWYNSFNRKKKDQPTTKSFLEPKFRMTPEAQARAIAKAAAMRTEMPLQEIRQARGLSQKMLAEVLKVNQPAIAKMEKRADVYILTLRSHIEAMGGELEIIARFSEGSVKITNLSGLDSPTTFQSEAQAPAENLMELS